MFRLRYGYFVSGSVIGLLLLWNLIWTLPDNKLHITVCDVGQGDAVYVRFPDGRDMLVDGGPSAAVLACLGRNMPFWDRSIDIVALTHPEHDHLAGLAVVAARYRIGTFIHSDIGDDRPEYQALHRLIVAAHTPIRTIIAGDSVRISGATLSAVWPSANQVAMMRPLGEAKGAVLGAASGSEHVNDGSLVMWLRYGTFDMLLAGDADIRVQPWYTGTHLADEVVEVLKVPHHGSRTGMTDSFISWLHPGLAVISVGRNTYGHPDRRTIAALEAQGARVMRTDEMGDVHIVSDGVTWSTEAVIKPTVEKMKGGLATPGRF